MLVFARLLHSSPSSTLDFLSSQSCPPSGDSGLHLLLRVWLDHQNVFYGSYVVKVTIFALMQLFQTHSARLASISVRGPEVASVGRRTRSKGPIQFTQIPATQKIFELVVSTFVMHALDDDEGGNGSFNAGDDFYDEGFSSEEDDQDLLGALDMGYERNSISSGGKMSLDEIMRIANAEMDEDDDELDPDFADDPINKQELMPSLREWLFNLMRSNVKAFEASVHACSDEEARVGFMHIWEAQIKLHLAKK